MHYKALLKYFLLPIIFLLSCNNLHSISYKIFSLNICHKTIFQGKSTINGMKEDLKPKFAYKQLKQLNISGTDFPQKTTISKIPFNKIKENLRMNIFTVSLIFLFGGLIIILLRYNRIKKRRIVKQEHYQAELEKTNKNLEKEKLNTKNTNIISTSEKTSTSSPPNKETNWEGKTILIVEDSRMAYDLIKKLLKGTNATFDLENDGKSAVERCIKDESIDLVLMDIQLPFVDGYNATMKIKEKRPQLPIIAQTANAMSDDRKKAFESGCNEYIAKPLDRKELKEKINKLLNNK